MKTATLMINSGVAFIAPLREAGFSENRINHVAENLSFVHINSKPYFCSFLKL